MKEQSVSLKLKVICAILTLCFIISFIGMFSQSGVLPISENDILSEDYRKDVSLQADYYSVSSGDITDSKGRFIQESTEPDNAGDVSYSYSFLIGYYHPEYGSYGLRGRYKNQLHHEYKSTEKGISIKLTTDNVLQERIYNLFRGRDASAIVLERHSGRILSLVTANSNAEFNPDHIFDEDMMEKYNSIDSFWYPKYTLNEPAGSVIKIFTSAAMLEASMEDFRFDDTGSINYNGGEIVNYDNTAYGNIGLKDSFVHSVNTYFAAATEKLGHSKINSLSDKLLFNNDIECDFGTVSSSFELGNTAYELGSAGYGQGRTGNTTVSLALMMQGICDRNIYKPHITDSLYVYKKNKQNVIQNIDESILSENVVSESTAKTIDELMLAASISYGLPAELGIRSKTGTADTGEIENPINRATFVSYNDNYIVVLSEHNTSQFGISLTDEVIEIYRYLSSLNT